MAYFGANYWGFQRQANNAPTIQSHVETAIGNVAQHPIICLAAGRTDTGVHASGQVIAWDMTWSHPTSALMRAINSHLPPDIALQAIVAVDEGFHPRYDAVSRTYLYRLYIAPARDPLRDHLMWHWQQALDTAIMRHALNMLIGTHDFATFGQPTQGDVTIRHMVTTALATVGDEIHITLTANGFLQRMVRSIVGTLVDVGRGKMGLADFETAFLAADRTRSGPSAPPHGLVLTHVTYRTLAF